jgi:hypothetical protein
VHQVKDLKHNDEIVLNEKETKKERRITLNKTCILTGASPAQSMSRVIKQDQTRLLRASSSDSWTVQGFRGSGFRGSDFHASGVEGVERFGFSG